MSFMEQSLTEAAPQAVRTVDNVDMLKAIADPTRVAILAALMKTRQDLPVMSVKELAAELSRAADQALPACATAGGG